MVRTPEGYGLYDSTLRQPFNGAYILACADRVLKEKEEKDFKSRFARKAKSDLRAYLDLKAKREAELEELYTRPDEDIAVDTPMDASEATAEAAHSPPGETADSAVELVDTDEYKEFIRDGYRLERKSPWVMLKDQRNGYNYTGFFHTGIRDIEVDPVGFFKVQHMGWRVAGLQDVAHL